MSVGRNREKSVYCHRKGAFFFLLVSESAAGLCCCDECCWGFLLVSFRGILDEASFFEGA